jgi:uncharacterized protein (TIGR04255 family)
MAKKSRSNPQVSHLPSAPLAEVIFEFRWKLKGDEGTPPPFQQDPGYFVCLESFFKAIKTYGFADSKRVPPGGALASAQSVEYRFYKKAGNDFPLVQIGPGVLAVNDSSSYVWNEYKPLCIDALERFLDSYPKLETYPLIPWQLDLKYIDAFKPSTTLGNDFLRFLEESTNFKVQLPEVLKSDLFEPIKAGQFSLNFPVRGKSNTNFSVVLGDREVSGVKNIFLQSSVNSTLTSNELGQSNKEILRSVARWLDDAHACTSPFFRSFVTDSLLAQFK